MLAVIGTENEIKLLINELYVIFCLNVNCTEIDMHVEFAYKTCFDFTNRLAGCVLKCDDV